ncbi:PP2C family protein-serine/threonine phosphatase [Synoicihabitans lomoniglobus]|uniref:Protein phosphatase 2C domain-containing protein n=1 Tax=Synoicihabitans lomoniglobus TaxID=2909285 RepID=A0AAF0CRM1_9BACT|nr:protein phosphatase 2C domain-containing protein [Opitutaceae bacterium LMO-M01]WED66768.1 protein phosphatase 2C domain-containing protein [Opitutaceae bacterium LMO-M01]
MPPPETSLLRSAAITDIGRVRRQNEDRFLRLSDPPFFAVADGIGGLPAGATAAQTTVDLLEEAVPGTSITHARDLVPLIEHINGEVSIIGLRLSPMYGIGTTLTCGRIVGHRLLLAHVGDSRCYLISDGEVRCLTEDHSVENEQKRRLDRGDKITPITDERTLVALTQCIGQTDSPVVETHEVELKSGDRIFFATDGITGLVSENELLTMLSTPEPLPERLANVVSTANERGGPDNATGILVEYDCPHHE